MRMGTCIDMCVGICKDMCTNMCLDTCREVCMGVCMDRLETWVGVGMVMCTELRFGHA